MAIIAGIFAIGGIGHKPGHATFGADVVMIQTDNRNTLSGSFAALGGLAHLARINLDSKATWQAPKGVLESTKDKQAAKSSAVKTDPDDTLVVPLQTKCLRPLQVWQATATIFYNKALAFAAVHTL